MEKPSILVVGSMNMDLVVAGVPKRAEFGESIFCEGYGYIPGGKGANQAITAAKLGGDAAMVGCLGADTNGARLLENLAAHGVDAENVARDESTQTGLAAMLIDEATAKYQCYVVLGGNARVSSQQVEKALARKKYDMLLMQLEMPLETVYKTWELAKAAGVPVFLDAGPAMDIPLDRLRGIDILSPNEAETKAMTGVEVVDEKSAREAAEILYQRATPRYVLLKLGGQGAALYDGNELTVVPCWQGIKAVDTTGAGDVFSAAFAVRYCRTGDALEAIRFAHAAAGISVTRSGAQAAIPTLAEVEEFLAAQGG